ncbi:hypothetical protein [Microbispora bryophytorum]|nr:hypothetical protein [Microbispora camponoti]
MPAPCSVGNDKIIIHRIYYDQLELYSQLGGELVFGGPSPA